MVLEKKKKSSPTFMTVHQIYHLILHLFCVLLKKQRC